MNNNIHSLKVRPKFSATAQRYLFLS